MIVLSEEKKSKITGLFLASLSLFPILRPAFQSILIIGFCLASVVLYWDNFSKRIKNRNLVFTFFLLTGYHIWYVFSSIWSEDIVSSIADAQSNIVLLLFPFIFLFFHPPLTKNITERVQLVFVLAMLIYLILWYRSYLSGVSHYQILRLQELPIREYSLFEQIEYFISKGFYWISGSSIRGYRLANEEVKLFVHHNYVASYLVVAFYAALNIIVHAKNLAFRTLMFFPVLTFMGFVFYLPSKMNQLILLVAIPIFIYYYFGKRTAIYLTGIGLIASCFLLYKNREEVSTIKFVEKESLISKEPSIIDFYRYHVYSCSVDKIPDNYVFGMGKGDVQLYLNACLPNDEWPGLSEVRREYNTHSQLLNYLISGGIIGLFLFIGLWVKLFSLAFRQSHSWLLILLFVIFANTLFENYLSRLWGCFIFVFFTFIYLQTDFNLLILKTNKDN